MMQWKKRVLNYLKAKNKKLKLEAWKVLKTENKGGTIRITFSLNENILKISRDRITAISIINSSECNFENLKKEMKDNCNGVPLSPGGRGSCQNEIKTVKTWSLQKQWPGVINAPAGVLSEKINPSRKFSGVGSSTA